MQREIEKRQDNETDFLAAFVAMVSGKQGATMWTIAAPCNVRSTRITTESHTHVSCACLCSTLALVVVQGGGADRSGSVSSDKLRKVIKEDFALTFKIDELLEDLDTESDGLLNYSEFKQLFS
jgi:hypothetical protein